MARKGYKKYASKGSKGKKTKRYSKKGGKKKGKYQKSAATLQSLLYLPRAYVKFNWDYQSTVVNATTSNVRRAFYANSIFDPDYDNATGDSANGFSLYSLLFSRYLVRGAKVTINIMTTTQTNTSMLKIACGFSNALISTSETWEMFSVNPYFKKKMISGQGRPGTYQFKGYVSVKKLIGLKILEAGSDSIYAGTMTDTGSGTVPSDPVFFQMFVFPLVPGTNLDFTYDVRITYYAELYNKTDNATYLLAGSTRKRSDEAKKQSEEIQKEKKETSEFIEIK